MSALLLRIAAWLVLLGVVLICVAIACDNKRGGADNYSYVGLFFVGIFFIIVALIILAGVGIVWLGGYHF